jgi:Galactose oxidase, central domain
MSVKNGAFKRLIKPRYQFEISEIHATGGGQAPCPRALHSACMLAGRYLAIFGGRNDKMFHLVGNVALNDLHLFDLQLL